MSRELLHCFHLIMAPAKPPLMECRELDQIISITNISRSLEQSPQARVVVDLLDTRTDQDEVAKSLRRGPRVLGSGAIYPRRISVQMHGIHKLPVDVQLLMESCAVANPNRP